MKTDRNVWAYCGIALAALLLLVAVYAVAYYAMVRPTPYLVDMSGIGSHPVNVVLPVYPRVAGIDWTIFFRPIHWFDRGLRPDVWKMKP